jgi:hypothetical protein
MKLFNQDYREMRREMAKAYKWLSVKQQTSRANFILDEFSNRLGTEYTFRVWSKLPRKLRNMII